MLEENPKGTKSTAKFQKSLSKVFWLYAVFTFINVLGFANFPIIAYHLQRNCIGDLFLTGLSVNENGKLTTTETSGKSPSLIWTKGMVIDKENKTASKCEVKEINGTTCMFDEWKSRDYINRGVTPQYYVLNKGKLLLIGEYI